MTPLLSDRFRPFLRSLTVALLGGVLLTATGAFGTHDAPLPARLSYWLLVMMIGGTWGHACGVVVHQRLDTDERPWLAVLILTAVITVPLSGVIWAATGLFFLQSLYPLSILPQFIIPVLVVTTAVCAVNVFLGRAQPRQTHAAASTAPMKPAPFLGRLPMKLRTASIRAVQAEDHYLRVHTDRGSDLILMRLSDAVEELEGLEGARTHRSWWVARDAVRDIERGDGRATLTLDDGLRVPVSRRYARALREADWW